MALQFEVDQEVEEFIDSIPQLMTEPPWCYNNTLLSGQTVGVNKVITRDRLGDIVLIHSFFIGPIPWGHSGFLCHALSLSSLASWTSMRRRRATVRWRHLVNWREAARCGEWAQHFSNASCYSRRR